MGNSASHSLWPGGEHHTHFERTGKARLWLRASHGSQTIMIKQLAYSILFSKAAYSALEITKWQHTCISLAHSLLLGSLCNSLLGQQEPVLARCLPPASSPLPQQAPTEVSGAFSALIWCLNTAGLALLGSEGFSDAESIHPVCIQKAHRYRGQALPHGLSFMECATAIAEQGNKPIKYFIEFLVLVMDSWMLLRLCSACFQLPALWLQRE